MSVVCGEEELKEWEMGGRGVCMRFEGGGIAGTRNTPGRGGKRKQGCQIRAGGVGGGVIECIPAVCWRVN